MTRARATTSHGVPRHLLRRRLQRRSRLRPLPEVQFESLEGVQEPAMQAPTRVLFVAMKSIVVAAEEVAVAVVERCVVRLRVCI